MAISKQVWRKGWRREAVETQAASAEAAALIGWLDERSFNESAEIIRKVAMRHGVREALRDLRSVFEDIDIRRKRGKLS
jgi:hypothetical protein